MLYNYYGVLQFILYILKLTLAIFSISYPVEILIKIFDNDPTDPT